MTEVLVQRITQHTSNCGRMYAL